MPMDKKVADDVLWGVKAIADEIGRPERQTYYGLEKGHIPAGKVGEIWVAYRSVLRAHFRELTTRQPAGEAA
jgi:hypothetical protein